MQLPNPICRKLEISVLFAKFREQFQAFGMICQQYTLYIWNMFLLEGLYMPSDVSKL